MQRNNCDSVIRYIKVSREDMNQYQKRKYDGSGDRGSQRGHFDRSRNYGQRNLEGYHNGNGAKFGGGHGGGRDGNNGRGGGGRGGHGSNTKPPTNTGRKFGPAVRPVGKEVGRSRKNDGLGDGDKIFVRKCRRGAHSDASHGRSQDICEA